MFEGLDRPAKTLTFLKCSFYDTKAQKIFLVTLKFHYAF